MDDIDEVVQLGFRLGPAPFRARQQWEQEHGQASSGTSTRQRPHRRRGHFRTYWTGRGRRVPKVNWIAPYWVSRDLLGYPIAGRVLFAAPSVISGWLFELQLRSLRRARVHELGRAAPLLPQFGFIVWMFHPFTALRHLSRIAGSRLNSVPVTVIDWSAPASVRELGTVPGEVMGERMHLAAPAEAEADDHGQAEVHMIEAEGTRDGAGEAVCVRQKAARSRVPDEPYLVKLRNLVDEAGGVVPSAREAARQLNVGQDRARRMLTALADEDADDAEPDAAE